MNDNEDIMCGIIHENGEFTPIYCNPTTGECYFEDSIMGTPRLIAEVSIADPVEMEFDDMIANYSENAYGKCMGVIYDGDCIIKLLTDSTAARYDIGDLNTEISPEFSIDIYGDYDVD